MVKPGEVRDPPRFAELEADYEILREIGRGGTAVVYLARERELDRLVAIKVIRSTYIEDAEATARLEREARMIGGLQHPNIVVLYATRRMGDGSLALIMQYARGRTLKDEIRAYGPLPFDRVQQVLEDVGAALAYAHRHRIVHRDVKPENIYLDAETGLARLSDFGIACVWDGRTKLTLPGSAIGTPTYMSPEQIDGATLDGRSDLYSLAMVGWEMVTGEQPWAGETLFGLIYKQKYELLPSLDTQRPNVPAALRHAIEGALGKSPARRWKDADEFVRALRGGAAPPLPLASPELPVPEHPAPAASAPDNPTVLFRPDEVLREGGASGAGAEVEGGADELPVTPAVQVAGRPVVRSRRPLVAAIVAVLLLTGATIVLALTARPFSDDIETAEPVAPALQIADPRDLGPGETIDDLIAGEQQDSPLPPVAGTASADSPGPAAEAAPEPADDAPATSAPAAASAEPQPEAPTTPAVRVSVRAGLFAGGMHTCMLTADGAPWCWGGNDHGQIGDGSRTRRAGPVALDVDLPFARLSAGVSHTCGIATDGTPYCWGSNDTGQLGTGDGQARPRPTPLASPGALSDIRAGVSHTCGLDPQGRLYCWGGNAEGQLGDGTRTVRPEAVEVGSPRRFRDVVPGWTHTCALSADGTAWCWGSNAAGELGTGDTRSRLVPAAVAGGHAFIDLAVGTSHTCGLRSDGTVLCWGANTYGQLGDATGRDSARPVAVLSDVPFADLTAGSMHTCARTADGRAFCWGRNMYGQLGDGTTEDRPRPTPVAGSHRFSGLNASGAHTCGTADAGARMCWGFNIEGQLGDGSRTSQSRPVAVLRPW